MIPRARHFADGRDVLNDADFVVNVHDGDRDGVVTHRRFELFQVNNTVALRRQIGHFETFTLQLAAGVQHGFVFGFAGDDVLAFSDKSWLHL